jgi:hypothetical protein
MGAIQGQGDAAQAMEWMMPTLSFTIAGCFAMTGK